MKIKELFDELVGIENHSDVTGMFFSNMLKFRSYTTSLKSYSVGELCNKCGGCYSLKFENNGLVADTIYLKCKNCGNFHYRLPLDFIKPEKEEVIKELQGAIKLLKENQ